MIAIETRYAGPTNTRGARIIATTGNGQRHVISYPHGLDTESAHRKAATELAETAGLLKPGLQLASGATKRGYAFVFIEPVLCGEEGCGEPKVLICPHHY